MKIGIDARPLSYQLTGIGFYLKYLLDHIQEADQDNYYYLISNTKIDYDIKNPKWSKIEGRFSKKLLSTIWVQLFTPVIAARLKLDIYWGARHHLPVFLSTGIKTVLTIHDLVHCFYPETMPLPSFLMERLFMRLSLLRSEQIMTVSRSTALDLQKIYKIHAGRISVTYPGVPGLKDNCEINQEEYIKPDFKYILFVGTLDPRKNFERIFKAFEFINPVKYGLHFVIAGAEGWKNREFVQMLKTHPLKDNIHLTGYVSRFRLADYYKNALCLVFPSIYEGFGFPVLEAMSCGTPVITADRSSMPETAGDAAVLVNPFNIDDIAQAILKMIENETERNNLIEKGFKQVKNFSWEKCAEQTIRVFNKAVIS